MLLFSTNSAFCLEPRIREETAVVPGIDGQKMSKSYENTIELFGAEKPLRKKIMSLVMDSRGMDEPKPDADRNIAVQLLKLVGSTEVASACEERLRAGGYGYGDLKKALFLEDLAGRAPRLVLRRL